MEIEVTLEQSEWPLTFNVQVRLDDVVRSQHLVTLSNDEYRNIDGTVEPVDLVKATFRFLLDREAPESILERFSLGQVKTYFPEYPEKIREYL